MCDDGICSIPAPTKVCTQEGIQEGCHTLLDLSSLAFDCGKALRVGVGRISLTDEVEQMHGPACIRSLIMAV